MIPQPQGFTIVLEPVDRERIESIVKELSTAAGFGHKTVVGHEMPCLMRVAAAGPGIRYDESGGGFIENHIHVGDTILGTLTELSVAKDFLDPKEHWEFDGRKYIVVRSRDYHDITGPTLFVVERNANVA